MIHPFFNLPRTATTEQILATLGLSNPAKGSAVVVDHARTSDQAQVASTANVAQVANVATVATTAVTAEKSAKATYAETALRSVRPVPENYNDAAIVLAFKT